MCFGLVNAGFNPGIMSIRATPNPRAYTKNRNPKPSTLNRGYCRGYLGGFGDSGSKSKELGLLAPRMGL